MTRFKDALLAELTASVADTPEGRTPHRRRPQPRLLAAAAVLVAVAAGLGLALAPAHDRPAYAVEQNADGTIEFTLNQLTDITGANRALREAGVRAKVLVPTDSCPQGAGTSIRNFAQWGGSEPVFSHPQPNVVAIHPDRIPADKILFMIAVRFQGDDHISLFDTVKPASPEPCIPLYLNPSPGPSPTGDGGPIVDTSPTPGIPTPPTASFAPSPSGR